MKKRYKEVISVPKFYVKWYAEPTQIPTKAEEMRKVVDAMVKMTKADVKASGPKAGGIKDWGCTLDGWSGYAIVEATNMTELSADMLRFVPYLHFEVTPVLTIDQQIQSMKKAMAAGKK
jgi:hypothetical protein